jgi:hypothetical protein
MPTDAAQAREKRDSRVPVPERPSPTDVPVSSALSTNNARRMVGASSHSQVQNRRAVACSANRVDRIGLAVMVITS